MRALALCLVALVGLASSSPAGVGRNAVEFRPDYIFLQDLNAFYKFHTTRADFSEAVATCKDEGGRLMVPNNEAEVKAVADFIKSDVSEWWVGIHDLYGEGTFASIEGIPVEDLYNNWGPGEPNDNEDQEDCVILTRTGSLSDIVCKTKKPFLCERTAENLKRNLNCETHDEEYTYFIESDKCYKLHKNPLKWSKAFKACSREGSHLVVINSESEARFLTQELAKYPASSLPGTFNKKQVHIGFNDLINTGEFQTVDGIPLSDTGYERWALGQPSSEEENEHCGSMLRDGTLDDINCNTKAMFFCERKLSNNNKLKFNSINVRTEDAEAEVP